MLNKDTNYIVSGLERSGTSMMMQVLEAGGIKIIYDNSRLPDINNPKGYYELEGGKIISRLMEGDYSLEPYRGKFIKITSYGLQYLPDGKYKIIYMERDIHEIIESMSAMAKMEYDNRITQIISKLNDYIKDMITKRPNTNTLFINYNEFIYDPDDDLDTICKFLNVDLDTNLMRSAIDKRLHRIKYD
jgi:hypothetical protein